MADDKKPNNKDEFNLIQGAKERLYSRTTKQKPAHQENVLHKINYQVPTGWGNQTDINNEPLQSEQPKVEAQVMPVMAMQPSNKKTSPILKKVLIGAAIFFVAAAAFAAFSLLSGLNTVSGKNVNINISGPNSVASGEPLSFQVIITNNNPEAMETADLLVEFPSGTKDAINKATNLSTTRTSLGDINSGDSISKTIQASLFGEEGVSEDITVSVEYRLPNSNAVFVKDQKYTLKISSSPVRITVGAPNEVVAGQETKFTITVSANTSETVNNLLLSAEYPFGFEFKSSDPSPTFEKNVWRLGSLAAGEQKVITMIGVINGDNEEERGFTFKVGEPRDSEQLQINKEYASFFQHIAVSKPFLALELNVNDSADSVIGVEPGQKVNGVINWQSNFPTNLSDLELSLSLSGQAIDRRSVGSQDGYFNSIQNKIIWTKQQMPEFKSISLGSSGSVSFSFNLIDSISLNNLVGQQQINLNANAVAKNSENPSADNVIMSSKQTVLKLNTSVIPTAKTLFATGPIKNTGFVPPKAERKTNYTVVLSTQNTTNSLSNAEMSFNLPPYAVFTGIFSPANEKVVYDKNSSKITWQIGDLESHSSADARKLYLQIAITPSLGDIGSVLPVLSNGIFKATDSFTNEQVKLSVNSPTTELDDSSDPESSLVTE